MMMDNGLHDSSVTPAQLLRIRGLMTQLIPLLEKIVGEHPDLHQRLFFNGGISILKGQLEKNPIPDEDLVSVYHFFKNQIEYIETGEQ